MCVCMCTYHVGETQQLLMSLQTVVLSMQALSSTGRKQKMKVLLCIITALYLRQVDSQGSAKNGHTKQRDAVFYQLKH